MRQLNPTSATEWIVEMSEVYPYFDERPEVLVKLGEDLWAFNKMTYFYGVDIYSPGFREFLPKWLPLLKKHRLSLMRSTHDHSPFQTRRQVILEYITNKMREIERIIGPEQIVEEQKTNP